MTRLQLPHFSDAHCKCSGRFRMDLRLQSIFMISLVCKLSDVPNRSQRKWCLTRDTTFTKTVQTMWRRHSNEVS